ncbi:hypothetical protein [Methylobacterium gossipiicola]|nr:hypothetical protein [Methylobacterium gossipiicola]
MTIVVTVKINDGIVLAADSATSFFRDDGNVLKIYNNANKTFNLVKGLSIGALTFGSGGIGSSSISTLTKDLRRRLSGEDPAHLDWKLDPNNYTLESVASRVREFFFEDKFLSAYGDNPPDDFMMGYKLCGYSSGAEQPELWDVPITAEGLVPKIIRDTSSCGANWDGEYEAMDRLFFGLGSNFRLALLNRGLPADQVNEIYLGLASELSAPLIIPAMPIQDAIELARFMVETTIRYVRFNLRSETVGGPIEIAAITKHEGFKWVQRKLFYQSDLNPPAG